MSSLFQMLNDDGEIAACGRDAQNRFSALYCAESVLGAVAEAEGIAESVIPRMATGFCSGMARTGGLCGAVAGAVMAVSLVHGRDSGEDPVEPAYARVAALCRAVEAKWGTCQCLALTGCDFTTQTGQDRFREQGLKESVCLPLADDCARLALWLVRAEITQVAQLCGGEEEERP